MYTTLEMDGRCVASTMCLGKTGAGKRARTADLLITNQLLYQLSYAGLRRELKLSRKGVPVHDAHPVHPPSQSLYGSNVSFPAMATPIGRKVWRILIVSPCAARTSFKSL
jgi:hypothetical protein